MENNITISDTLLTLIESKKFSTIKDILVTMNSVDIASLFEDMPEEILPKLFRLLPKELAADTFVEMESDLQELLVKGFSDRELKDVINELYVDDAVDIIEEMPANVVNRILKQASPEMRKDINELLKYPEDSVGSVMTTEFVNLKSNVTVEAALEHIHKTALDKETINTCYVTQRDRVLIGSVTLRTLILAKPTDIIRDIMDTNVMSVSTDEDKESVAMLFDKYDHIAMPVVDNENRLVGIVTVDDAIDVIQEEASEDIEKMAAILPSEKPYLRTGVFETFKARIPWLLFLMISATFTGAIISKFELQLTTYAALIVFIPMLMGTGGNSGSQASVTVIRALSLGDVEFSDIRRVIWKELRVSAICGLALSVINFGKLYLIDYLLLNNFDAMVAIPEMLVVCITLFLVVVVAKFIGCTLPIIAKRLGFDPAVMASPLVTTILDTFSLLIYFTIAALILKI